MTTVQEIQTAIARLSPEELRRFRDWFDGFEATLWDSRFEEDARAGRLDSLAAEALEDMGRGRCKPTRP